MTLIRTTRGRLALLLGASAVAVAVGLGVAQATGNGPSGPPNSLGRGGHARPLKATPLAPTAISQTVRDALASAGASAPASVARVGTGDHAAQLLSVRVPGGGTCLTVAHAGGKVVEPPNCANDSYLRVWSDASGTGDPASGAVASARVIAVVSAEVKTVRVSFADGSVKTLAPNASGVVTVESSGGSARPVAVEALAANGSSLGSASV